MPLWTTGRWTWFRTPDRRILLLSVAVQLLLALFLGHSYDSRVFMSAGYLVGHGQNPYVAHDLMAAFHHLNFDAAGSVGYPPPWPLVLGLLFKVSYALVPNLFFYNLVLKLPVVAATVGLAYLVAATLQNRGVQPSVCRKAWVFLLLNPFLLYFGAAWGQIDAIAALFALTALVLLQARWSVLSALLLALAVCVKPIAAPILIVVLIYLLGRSRRQTAGYAAVFLAGAFVFYLLPFLVLGWSLPPANLVNAHFAMSGSMSFMAIVRLARGSVLLTGHWWLLGLMWIPALGLAAIVLRRGVRDFEDLITKSAALVLVFFLTRTWLAEPDTVLVLVLVLASVSLGRLDRRALTAAWVIPLLFTAFNASPLRLLWVAFPGAMQQWLSAVGRHGLGMVIGRGVVTIVWQAAGWWIVLRCLRAQPAAAPVGDRRPAVLHPDRAPVGPAPAGAPPQASALDAPAGGPAPWS